MPISVTCPDCQTTVEVLDNAAGKRFRCRDCGGIVTVPGGLDTEAEIGDLSTAEPSESGVPPRRQSRRADSQAPASNSTAGNVSLIIGCCVWGVTIIGFIAMVIFVGSMMNDAGPAPEPEQIMMVGMGGLVFCAVGGLGWLASFVGGIFGVIGISDANSKRVTAILGLIANGLYFVGVAGFFLFSMIMAAADR